MKRSGTRLAIPVGILLLAFLIAGCGGSGKREGAIGPNPAQTGIVQTGDPVLAPAAGYVGSQVCSTCHPTQFTGWSKSLHNFPLKTVAELGSAIFVNDANGNGVNDFQDGLDLAATPAFASFADNAPRLSAAGGRFFATIGAVTYEVQRVQGGNGYWKQRYHTKIGRSYYILPFQYNEKTKAYVQYNASNWYDGTAPRYTAAYGTDALVVQFGDAGATSSRGTQVSWENRCAGCHQTGLNVQAQTTSYGGTDVQETVTGYSELNIGCERCHGPGASHAASRNPADIINPANFEALGVTGKRVANQVCGACHSRGESDATLLSGASPLPLEYPARFVSGVLQLPLPGNSVVDNSAGNPFVVLNTSSAYYGAPPLRFFTEYGGWYAGYDFPTYIASRQHHQQWTDIEQGPHSADVSGNTCFSCHDPHKAAGNPDADPGDDHQIRTTITRGGVTVATKDDDDSLCLSCHVGSGPFAALTASDIFPGSTAVADSVLSHMIEEANMTGVDFDPEEEGHGRCSLCHMPKTASSAIRTAFGAGLQEGDIHNHSFNILYPSVNVYADNTMANSCYQTGVCHNNDPGSEKYVSELAEWSTSAHANFTDEPFRHWDNDNPRVVPNTPCAKCHTKAGYAEFATTGSIAAPVPVGSVISCGACHTQGTTRFAVRTANDPLDNVVFPSGIKQTLGDASNECMVCHQGRASKVQVDAAIAVDNGANNLTFINNHYFAAAATLFGTDVRGGYEYDNNSNVGARTYVGRFLHISPFRNTCVKCHMGNDLDRQENNHRFFPKTEYCGGCHVSVPVPDDPADETRFRSIRGVGDPPQNGTLGIDFDGDGNATEGLYFEIWDTLVPGLYAQIQNYADNVIGTPIVYAPGVYPYWFKDTNANGLVDAGEAVFANRYTGFDPTLLKAAYNFTVVQNEPCGYIHNGRYIIQLIRDSIEDLSGVAPPGVRP